jgi:hypothetical protein
MVHAIVGIRARARRGAGGRVSRGRLSPYLGWVLVQIQLLVRC